MIKRYFSLLSVLLLVALFILLRSGLGSAEEAQAAGPTPSSTAMPGADFVGSPLTGVAPLAVQFTALNASILSRCTWSFGDGTSQSFTPPAGQNMYYCPTTTHTYTTAGSYSVGLAVTKVTGTSNSLTKTDYILVSLSSGTLPPTFTSTSSPSYTPTGNLPDLIVTAISGGYPWASTGSCILNTFVGINVTVKNTGTATAGTFLVEVNNNSNILQTVNGLAVNQSKTVWFDVSPQQTNTATVDVTNLVSESNESNNTLTVTQGSGTATRTGTPPPVCTPTPTIPTGASSTPTPTPTRTNTATPTPTGGTAAPCSPVTATITAPFTEDGAGTFCWQSTNLGSYINSWNLASLTVNGVDFTNKYAATSSLPAKINGYWYISYTGNFAWSHFETK